MNSNDPLSLDNQLCFSLYSTSLAITQLYKPLLEPLGLTYPQYLIMLILWEEDGVGLKDIAARLGQKSGALTPVIKRLEQEQLVMRSRDSADERALSIRLTKKGKELKKQGLIINKCISDACGLNQKALASLKEALDELRADLQKTK